MSSKQQNNKTTVPKVPKTPKTPKTLETAETPKTLIVPKTVKKSIKKVDTSDSDSDSDSNASNSNASDSNASDSDSNASDLESSVSETISNALDCESDNETVNNSIKTDILSKKNKTLVKQKKEIDKVSHIDLLSQINELRQNKKLRKIKFLEAQKEFEKEDNNDDKLLDKLISQLPKVHNDEKNSISKIKIKKPSKPNTGGIHKLDDVPHVFIKFFGKEENTQMAFKDILSQLHSKLKELGLKSGQKTTLDEKTAKLFNHPDYPAGTVIDFSGYGTFIKKICAQHSVKNNVSL